MNDVENDNIQALTDQPVTISLGGKSYQARQATLYDIGVVQRYRKKLEEAKDTSNIEVDSSIFLLCELIKEYTPDMTPEKLAKSIPIGSAGEVADALEKCGFFQKAPAKGKPKPTGEDSTP